MSGSVLYVVALLCFMFLCRRFIRRSKAFWLLKVLLIGFSLFVAYLGG